eukprot:CAMPEP_0204843164 /NCGR_PEP_ID=MMETSP1346-20131115/47814_1 /ASSEMBLY_ACC=CAM_ASM_000771 /TAXON_ID=215587 /ORGANISM="Aplanochytrium stocchinoi, Strain GSBS06" /LENGTH=355 /DNA_ID=CAMNT_0051982255 /DNA_START=155 /DNA_END=1222 /DNA_ORIENTATION=+
MMPRLRALLCADAPSVWRAAGFVVDSNNQIDLGTLTIKLVSGNNTAKDVKPKGFTSWVWSGISSLDLDENNGRYSIDGVATHISISEPELNASNRKNKYNIQMGLHMLITYLSNVDVFRFRNIVVLRSGDLERTKEAFGKIGLPLRREANDIYPGITQLFYRPGDEVIIEVVGFTAASTGTETSSQAPHSFLWGATFTVKDDLTIAKALLQDKLSEIREAKQRVVLRSGDLERTKEAFGKIGLPLRREANDIYPGITQLFYRPGDEVIIEVVGFTAASTGTETSSQAPHSFLWGATFTVKDDLTIAKALLQDKLSEIREAKQRGRRIATLRNKELNISAALALMTPHVPKPSSVL